MTYWNSDPKPEPKKKRPRIPLKRSPVKPKRSKTGELAVMRLIVEHRGSKSEITGEPIYNITVSSMMHILSKKQYPKFRLYEKNILIVTPHQHYLFDFTPHSDLRLLPEWEKVFKLRDELIEEYKNLPE